IHNWVISLELKKLQKGLHLKIIIQDYYDSFSYPKPLIFPILSKKKKKIKGFGEQNFRPRKTHYYLK
ncbi:MAG: hypothetical protein IJO63_04395, partial [Bacilli bacterium]|nr:hypothetical protein [Bacilli bacterium]